MIQYLKLFPGYGDFYSFTWRESKWEGEGGGEDESVVCKWSAQKINYGQVTELFWCVNWIIPTCWCFIIKRPFSLWEILLNFVLKEETNHQSGGGRGTQRAQPIKLEECSRILNDLL